MKNGLPHDQQGNDSHLQEKEIDDKRAEKKKLALRRKQQVLDEMREKQIRANFIYSEIDGNEFGQSIEADTKVSACLGKDRTISTISNVEFSCIVCKSSENIDGFFYPAIIQRSNALNWSDEINVVKHNSTQEWKEWQEEKQDDRYVFPYVSSCGHEIHYKCASEIFKEEEEFPSCPCCGFCVEDLMPVFTHSNSVINQNSAEIVNESFSFKELFDIIRNDIQTDAYLNDNGYEYKEIDELLMKSFNKIINDKVSEFIQKLRDIAPLGFNNVDSIEDIGKFVAAWNTCSYVIQTVEMYMRAEKKPLTEVPFGYTKCVSGLVNICFFYEQLDVTSRNNLPDNYRALKNYALSLFDKLSGHDPESSIINWDSFSMMTSMIFIIRPLLFPLHLQDHILR